MSDIDISNTGTRVKTQPVGEPIKWLTIEDIPPSVGYDPVSPYWLRNKINTVLTRKLDAGELPVVRKEDVAKLTLIMDKITEHGFECEVGVERQ